MIGGHADAPDAIVRAGFDDDSVASLPEKLF